MINLLMLLLSLGLVVGCAGRRVATEDGKEQATTGGSQKQIADQTGPLLTPSYEKVGRIAMVNKGARFVVLSFPIGDVAGPQQRLNVYREGIKVGEIQVTGPQRENNTVADIVAGSPEVNDEVREN